MPRFRIEVTAEDIEHGARDSPFACPIARAAARAIGIDILLGEIDVDADGIYLRGRGGLRRASRPLPPAAIRFLHDFDSGRPVAPFGFTKAIRVGRPHGREGQGYRRSR